MHLVESSERIRAIINTKYLNPNQIRVILAIHETVVSKNARNDPSDKRLTYICTEYNSLTL